MQNSGSGSVVLCLLFSRYLFIHFCLFLFQTALHYAAREGDVKCLNYLLERENVDVNAQCGVSFSFKTLLKFLVP